MSKELIEMTAVNAVEIFTNDGLEDLLSSIEKEVLSFVPDLSTDKGRKEIASMAYKVARSKTALDNMGKELVSDLKARVKIVDVSRKTARDRLDALRDTVRAPLDEWESAEQKRLEAEAAKKEMDDAHDDALSYNELFDRRRVIEAKEAEIREREEAAAKVEREAEEKRLRIEREDQIREEAAEKERAASQQREAAAAAALEKAESDRVAAAEQARIDKENAVKQAQREAQEEADRKERKRLADEAEEKRLADITAENIEHRKEVNRAALKSLVDLGLEKEDGKTLIKAIIAGKVLHVTINY